LLEVRQPDLLSDRLPEKTLLHQLCDTIKHDAALSPHLHAMQASVMQARHA
jgi:hypothetical protein